MLSLKTWESWTFCLGHSTYVCEITYSNMEKVLITSAFLITNMAEYLYEIVTTIAKLLNKKELHERVEHVSITNTNVVLVL